MLNKFLKAGFGGAGSQAINLLSLPVIARLYAPEAFAAWAVVMAVVGIIGGISCLRYELAIVIPEENESAAALFWLCISTSAAISVITSGLLYLCWQLGIFSSGGIIGILYYTLFTPIMVFTTGCTLALRYWHVRLGNFAINSFSMLALSLSVFLIQIIWAFSINTNYSGLLMGSIGGQMVTLVVLIFGWKREVLPNLKQARLQIMIKTGQDYIQFLKYSTPYALIGVIRSRLPILILEAFLPMKQVGLYSLAFRVMYSPLNLVSGALRPVIFQAAAAGGVKSVEKQINRILTVLAVTVAPVIVFYFFYADNLFKSIFGVQWIEAGEIGKFVIIPASAFLFCGWMDRLFDVLGQQKLMMILEFIFAGLSIAGLWIGLSLGNGFSRGLFLQCSILLGYALIYLFLGYDKANFDKRHLVKITLLIAGATGLAVPFIKWIRIIL